MTLRSIGNLKQLGGSHLNLQISEHFAYHKSSQNKGHHNSQQEALRWTQVGVSHQSPLPPRYASLVKFG